LQTIVFKIASAIYNSEKKPDWKGSKETFLIQLITIIEKFIYSDKIVIKNPLFNQDESRKRILIMLNMNKVVQHIWNEIRAVNSEALTPIFDKENPIRSTSDIRTWWTSKPCEAFDKTHINFVVVDSKWEFLEAKTLNESNVVKSFVKNDHLNFVVFYNYQGVVRRYFPDFLIKLSNGENLIVETKGKDDEQNKTKRSYLDEWCRAVNEHGGFGLWSWAVSFNPNDLDLILHNSFTSFNGHIYLDTENDEVAFKVFSAIKHLLRENGFEVSKETEVIKGSRINNIWFKITSPLRSKEAKELFEKTKKAIELAKLDKLQSEVNKNNFEAAAAFLNSVKDVPNVATVMGSLVIVKATVNGTPQLLIRNLTIEQTIQLEKNSSLMNNPLQLLNILNNNPGNNLLN